MDLHEDEGTLTYHYTTVLTLESPDEMMDVEVTGQAEEATERLLELPLSLDPLYNLIVCSHCCVALPWEWVGSHLKEQHAIETTDEQVSHFLGLQDSALTVQQVKDWRESVVVGKAVQDIPVIKGYRCNLIISSSPETLSGLTKWLTHVDANRVAQSASTFLQSPDPFGCPQRVPNVDAISQSRGPEK
jgi:hypothetical protein